MLEALIAGMVIIMFAVVITGGNYALHEKKLDLDSTAYYMLKGLDEEGILRPYAFAMDASGLNSEIDIPGRNHAIEICDSSGSCFGQKPDYQNVWAGTYIVAGDTAYQPRIVKLFLW